MVLRGKVLAAYIVVCVLWGSTYIAIRIGDRTLPPLLFAGVRFLTAGAMLFVAARVAGQRLPARARDWRDLSIVGLLLLSGNTCVVVAERFTPAGVAPVKASDWKVPVAAGAIPSIRTPISSPERPF